MRLPLLYGAYDARSLIAEAQRCVNLYPENNPKGAPSPTTHYPTPGLTLLGVAPNKARVRATYRASNGNLYVVSNDTVYYVDPTWSFTQLGQIAQGVNPVSMSDNGVNLVLVDGTPNGYSIGLGTNVFAPINDPNFFGADRVDFVDTFFLFNKPGTPIFYASGSEALTFFGLDFAAKTGFPDPIQSLICMHREVYLIGTLTSEVWYNAGTAPFTFAEMPGTFIEHGTVAKYSVAKQDLMVFTLSQDEQGQAIVLVLEGFQAKRISTHALENELQSYATISDAIGFCYQQDGHTFYVLTFPSADKTWCFDVAGGQWHERTWVDGQGNLHRHRANCCTNAYGKIVVGDHENGNLYAFDLSNYTDNGNPIPRIRSFPHLIEDGNRVVYTRFVADMECGAASTNVPDPVIVPVVGETRVAFDPSKHAYIRAAFTYAAVDGGETMISPEATLSDLNCTLTNFTIKSPPEVPGALGWYPYIAGIDGSLPAPGTETKQSNDPLPFGTDWTTAAGIIAGAATPVTNTTNDNGPKVYLRWSNDRGKTYSNKIARSMGKGGQYDVLPQWRRLGIARDRVYELSWSEPVPTALNGAFAEGLPAAS